MQSMDRIRGIDPALQARLTQLWVQGYGVLVTIVYGGAVSFVILKVIDWTMGLRVGEEIERDGLDLALHGETVS